jgi:hypothetical protein
MPAHSRTGLNGLVTQPRGFQDAVARIHTLLPHFSCQHLALSNLSGPPDLRPRPRLSQSLARWLRLGRDTNAWQDTRAPGAHGSLRPLEERTTGLAVKWLSLGQRRMRLFERLRRLRGLWETAAIGRSLCRRDVRAPGSRLPVTRTCSTQRAKRASRSKSGTVAAQERVAHRAPLFRHKGL